MVQKRFHRGGRTRAVLLKNDFESVGKIYKITEREQNGMRRGSKAKSKNFLGERMNRLF